MYNLAKAREYVEEARKSGYKKYRELPTELKEKIKKVFAGMGEELGNFWLEMFEQSDVIETPNMWLEVAKREAEKSR